MVNEVSHSPCLAFQTSWGLRESAAPLGTGIVKHEDREAAAENRSFLRKTSQKYHSYYSTTRPQSMYGPMACLLIKASKSGFLDYFKRVVRFRWLRERSDGQTLSEADGDVVFRVPWHCKMALSLTHPSI